MNFKINSRPLFTIIFKLKNDNFKTRDFSPLIERALAGVWGQRPREVTFHFTIEILDYKTWIYNQKIKVFHEKFAD